MNRYANGAAYVRQRFVPIEEASLPVTDLRVESIR